MSLSTSTYNSNFCNSVTNLGPSNTLNLFSLHSKQKRYSPYQKWSQQPPASPAKHENIPQSPPYQTKMLRVPPFAIFQSPSFLEEDTCHGLETHIFIRQLIMQASSSQIKLSNFTIYLECSTIKVEIQKQALYV